MRQLTLLGFAALLAFGPAGAATAGKQTAARDHFFEAAVSEQAGEPQWRGVRTSVLLRRDRKNDDPIIREAGDNAEFRSGDSFRMRVETNMDGYLYLFLSDSAGKVSLLFPDEKGKAKTNKVSAFESRLVPGRPGVWYRFDSNPGTERMFLFLSANPIPELERLKRGVTGASLQNLKTLIENQDTPEFLRFDESDLEESGKVGATYYVEKRTAQRQFLVQQIELSHKGN